MIAALVPAAGRSVRMGRPKLILPVDGEPLIARVVSALRSGGAERVVVVTPPEDAPGASELIDIAKRAGAEIAGLSTATDDMRATVEFGIAWIARGPTPDALLLAPGDSPGITAGLVSAVIAAHGNDHRSIVVPTHESGGGHPVLMPWSLALEIETLPPGHGVNALMKTHADRVLRVETSDPGAAGDLDTPEDYQKWSARGGPASCGPGRD
jgi:molybdenum cofactor cytidylyltransferase